MSIQSYCFDRKYLFYLIYLSISLTLFYLFLSLRPESPVTALLYLLIPLVGVYIASPHKQNWLIATSYALIFFILILGQTFVNNIIIAYFVVLFGGLSYGFAIYLILKDIIRAQIVNSNVIYGAISGYLLLGIIWSFLYGLFATQGLIKFSTEEEILSVAGDNIVFGNRKVSLGDYTIFKFDNKLDALSLEGIASFDGKEERPFFIYAIKEFDFSEDIIFLAGIASMGEEEEPCRFNCTIKLNLKGQNNIGIEGIIRLDKSEEKIPLRGTVNIDRHRNIASYSAYIYYSFVTLTTLGYGDITPASQLCRFLAMAEVLMGQFYMTILIALLIGKYLTHSGKNFE